MMTQKVLTIRSADDTTQKPNVVLIVSDDQDVLLGGLDSMPRTLELLGEEGLTFDAAFANTPVCCPSRAQIISGRYGHTNLVESGEGGCMHANITSPDFVNNNIGLKMSALGYETGLFGKYMNNPACECPVESGCVLPSVNATRAIPPGWDRWFAACTMGIFYNNTFSSDGVDVKYGDADEDYMTSVIGNETVDWIRETVEESPGTPFFAYVAPHAPHIADSIYPYVTTPAPWYLGTENRTAPRTPNWNELNSDAHFLVSSQPAMDAENIAWSDLAFARRSEACMSIDDLVADVVGTLSELSVLDNTFVFFTSDHGYSLGQLRFPSGKWNVYEWNIRVPMLVRGPGISPGSRITTHAVGNVDLAPTIVELGGGGPDPSFDGRSMVPLFQPGNQIWRSAYLIEYWSLGTVMRGAPTSERCNPDEGTCAAGCPCHLHMEDGPNNTFIGLRVVNSSHNFLYVEFYVDRVQKSFDGMTPVFVELYNVTEDPWQRHNLRSTAPPDLLEGFREELHDQYGCRGFECL